MWPRVIALVVGLALALVTVSAVVAVSTGHWRGQGPRQVLQLVVLSAAWLLVNSPVEGRVLWELGPTHGLTSSDLLVAVPLLVAAVQTALLLGA